jgi:hypothetical protein
MLKIMSEQEVADLKIPKGTCLFLMNDGKWAWKPDYSIDPLPEISCVMAFVARSVANGILPATVIDVLWEIVNNAE